jgi:hypothetical protein
MITWGKLLPLLQQWGVVEVLNALTVTKDGQRIVVHALERNAGAGNQFVMSHPLPTATAATVVQAGTIQSICDHLAIPPRLLGLTLP